MTVPLVLPFQQNIRSNGIFVSSDWIRQSINYLSRTGPLPADCGLVAEKIYPLFLDSDLHEIISVDEITALPSNTAKLHKCCLGNNTIVLQVRGYSFFRQNS
jgi:hypothetical protein